MVNDLDLRLLPGQALLIKGPWAAADHAAARAGRLVALCARPAAAALGARALFLSQRPCLPLGELRGGGVSGPAGPQDDARLADALGA